MLDSLSIACFYENKVWICHVWGWMVLLVCSLFISGSFFLEQVLMLDFLWFDSCLLLCVNGNYCWNLVCHAWMVSSVYLILVSGNFESNSSEGDDVVTV